MPNKKTAGERMDMGFKTSEQRSKNAANRQKAHWVAEALHEFAVICRDPEIVQQSSIDSVDSSGGQPDLQHILETIAKRLEDRAQALMNDSTG